jgi:hypothetical protein
LTSTPLTPSTRGCSARLGVGGDLPDAICPPSLQLGQESVDLVHQLVRIAEGDDVLVGTLALYEDITVETRDIVGG